MRGVIVLREPLGSEIVAHFKVDAPPALTEDVRELARDVGQESAVRAAEAEGADETTMVGRFGPRSRIKDGDVVDVAVETGAMHFFDLETGLGIYSQDGQAKLDTQVQRRGRSTRMRKRWLVFALLVGALAFVAAGCGGGRRRGQRRGQRGRHRRHLDHGDLGRRGAGVVPGRDRRLQRAVSEREREVHLRRRQPRRRCSRPRSKAATRPTSRPSASPG